MTGSEGGPTVAVDSSAIAALLFGEPSQQRVAELLSGAACVIGAPTRVELGMVVEARTGAAGVLRLESLLRAAVIDVVDFTAQHATIANEAFRSYGKGRHRAGLNFGDCMSYATAKVGGFPLLYVGDDFSYTDISSAFDPTALDPTALDQGH